MKWYSTHWSIPISLYTLSLDIDEDHGSGFIEEDDDEANSEVKLHRINIANEMWESYLEYMANTDSETGNSSDDFSDLSQ